MSKNLTTGSEGGLFVTNDDIVCERAKTLQYLGEIVIPGRERQDQQYNARGMGWMYRGDVFGQAFCRSQLRRLEAMNEARIRNCHVLTDGLRGVKGIRTPYEPPHVRHSYYNYVITLHPEEVGLDVPIRTFFDKFTKAVRAEGMSVGQWQRMPVPCQTIFQSRSGYGKGCPWKCQHARDVVYRPEDYPKAKKFIDAAIYVFGINTPNDERLMKRFVEAVRKVMEQPAKILEIPDAK
jgi:dTDP-4-amino-4,6-dideoxygalactose transaminase